MSIVTSIRNHFSAVDTKGKNSKQVACEYGKKVVVDGAIVSGSIYAMEFAEGMSVGARGADKATKAAINNTANTIYNGAAVVGTVGIVHGTYCATKAAIAALDYTCNLDELDD